MTASPLRAPLLAAAASSLLLAGCAGLPAPRGTTALPRPGALSAADLALDPPQPPEDRIAFRAETLRVEEETGIAIAEGDVVARSGAYRLRADRVTYDQRAGTVVAEGNVRITDLQGNLTTADRVSLQDDLGRGVAERIRLALAEGGRFSAATGTRQESGVTDLTDASYTTCLPCQGNPDSPPLWRLRAREVRHDPETRDVTYRDATLELAGIPILYAPVFSHPDPGVERRSGFLKPSLGVKGDLGAVIRTYYFWDIEPGLDATVEATYASEQGPLLGAELRRRFATGAVEGSFSVTRADRDIETFAGVGSGIDVLRGHLFAKGRFDLSEHWRTGFDVELVSDITYLQQYDYSNEDVLVTIADVEWFDVRDYFVAEGYLVDDLRPASRADQPLVLPHARFQAFGDPGGLWGGRWTVAGDLLALTRTPGQDVVRASALAGWARRLIGGEGLVFDVDVTARGDIWSVRQRDLATVADPDDRSTFAVRFYPQAQVTASWPFARPFGDVMVRVEPIAALTLAPDVVGETTDAPNEDSRDVELDATNLFEGNRFPGLDRVEDNGRVTFGGRIGAFDARGNFATFFIGQSFRFTDEQSFPVGSGLEDQLSDFVGRLQVYIADNVGLDYRFRLASDNLDNRVQEVVLSLGPEDLRLDASYLFVTPIAGNPLSEGRQELNLALEAQVAPFWRVEAETRARLGPDSQILRAELELIYEDECLLVALSGERDLTDRIGGDGDTSIFLRVGFKPLGEIAGGT